MNKSAAFLRKAGSIAELTRWDKEAKQRSGYIVEQIIELDKAEFDRFANDLFADQDFIKENNDLMFVDKNGLKHCILVKPIGGTTGILVESEGYDYPRYAAVVDITIMKA